METPVFTNVRRELGVGESYFGNITDLPGLLRGIRQKFRKINGKEISDSDFRKYFTYPIYQCLLRVVHGYQETHYSRQYDESSNIFYITTTSGRKICINIGETIKINGENLKNPLYYLITEHLRIPVDVYKPSIRISIKGTGVSNPSDNEETVDLRTDGRNSPRGTHWREEMELEMQNILNAQGKHSIEQYYREATDLGNLNRYTYIIARLVLGFIPIKSFLFDSQLTSTQAVNPNIQRYRFSFIVNPKDLEITTLRNNPNMLGRFYKISLEEANTRLPRVSGSMQLHLTVYYELGPDLRELLDNNEILINFDFLKKYFYYHPFFSDIFQKSKDDGGIIPFFIRLFEKSYYDAILETIFFEPFTNDSPQNYSLGGRQDPDDLVKKEVSEFDYNQFVDCFVNKIIYIMMIVDKKYTEREKEEIFRVFEGLLYKNILGLLEYQGDDFKECLRYIHIDERNDAVKILRDLLKKAKGTGAGTL